MPDQDIYPVSITNPWPRQRHRWFIVASLAGFLATMVAFYGDTHAGHLDPIQRFYADQYLRTQILQWLTSKQSVFDLLEAGEGSQMALPGAVLEDPSAPYGLALSPAALAQGLTHLRKVHDPHILVTSMYTLLRTKVFQDQPLPQIFPHTRWTLLALCPIGLALGLRADWVYRKKLLRGVVRRGPRLVDRHDFNVARQSDGIGFRTEEKVTLSARLDPRYSPRLSRFTGVLLSRGDRRSLSIPGRSENYHLAIMGSSGTGKSILLRQLLREIQSRGEATVIYDPAGEFTAEFYNEARGDVILNPLDSRCPFWSAVNELTTNTEALTLAESLFPDTHSENQFFQRAPRKIFARLIQFGPDPDELAAWLSLPDEIDKRVAGTEMAHMLGKAAGAQRMGVLASLGMVADSLRMLPDRTDNMGTWTAREWAAKRDGWVFFTSTATTRAPLRPLQSLWLDSIILQLMKTPLQQVTRPAWIILDELASLQKLPQLETGLTELRKYCVSIVLGFQGQSQVQEVYGEKGAETILGQTATKIFLRTQEPNAAEWISKTIGDQEVERVRPSHTQQEGLKSKNSDSYTREIKSERAVTTAQILGLTDRHGYIKQENLISQFVLPVTPAIHNVKSIIERPQSEFTKLVLPAGFQPPQDPPGSNYDPGTGSAAVESHSEQTTTVSDPATLVLSSPPPDGLSRYGLKPESSAPPERNSTDDSQPDSAGRPRRGPTGTPEPFQAAAPLPTDDGATSPSEIPLHAPLFDPDRPEQLVPKAGPVAPTNPKPRRLSALDA